MSPFGMTWGIEERCRLAGAPDRDTLDRVTQSAPWLAADPTDGNGVRGVIGCLCFIRWSLRPTVAEVTTAVDAIVDARRMLGRPAVLIVVVDPEMEVPTPAVALELMRTVPILERAIAGGVSIVPGKSLHARALRGTVSAVGSLFRVGWDLCDNQDDAVALMCRRHDLDFEAVRAEALARGLMLPEERLGRG